MSFYVYILQSQSNDSFYKGSTNDLLRRLEEHNASHEASTSRYVPWDLVWFTTKETRSEAMILEKKLKNLTANRLIEFIKKYPVPVGGPDVARVRHIRMLTEASASNSLRHHFKIKC